MTICELYLELINSYELINTLLLCILWIQIVFIFILIYIRNEKN